MLTKEEISEETNRIFRKEVKKSLDSILKVKYLFILICYMGLATSSLNLTYKLLGVDMFIGAFMMITQIGLFVLFLYALNNEKTKYMNSITELEGIDLFEIMDQRSKNIPAPIRG